MRSAPGCSAWPRLRPPARGPAISPAARAVHDSLLTLDTHLDTPANFSRPGWDFAEAHALDRDFSPVDLPGMKAGGLDGGFFAIYTPQGPRTPKATRAARDAALLRAVEIRETVARLGQRTALATTADDAARIAASGRVIVYQSIENAWPLAGDVTLLAVFHRRGVWLVGITHFANNDSATVRPIRRARNGMASARWVAIWSGRPIDLV